MSNLATICFDVIGSVQQQIRVVQENTTAEEVVNKLNEGTCFTTLEVSGNDTVRTIVEFDDNGNEITVAEIIKQTMMDETVYQSFQLEDPELFPVSEE